jgi:hypothetical protein
MFGKTLGRLQQKALVAVGARKMDDTDFSILAKNVDDLNKFYHDLKKHLETLERAFFATAEPLMSVSATLVSAVNTNRSKTA